MTLLVDEVNKKYLTEDALVNLNDRNCMSRMDEIFDVSKEMVVTQPQMDKDKIAEKWLRPILSRSLVRRCTRKMFRGV